MYEKIKSERFPDSIHTITDIRNDRSIRKEILRIGGLPEFQTTKQAIWLSYIRRSFFEGLITEKEYERLKDWRIKW